MSELNELKISYDRQKRVLENLKKNYKRRKNLDLIDPSYQRQILYDIKKTENELSSLLRQINSLESIEARKKLFNNK